MATTPYFFSWLASRDIVVVEAPLGDAVDVEPLDLVGREVELVRAVVPRRRREIVVGRRLARAAIASLGFQPTELMPDRDRVPRWPAGVVGCITHSADHCAVAVARADAVAGIGLDLEPARPLADDLADTICRADERSADAHMPGVPPALLATAVFSGKESFYKCVFPLARRRLEFDEVRITLDWPGETFTATLLVAAGPFPSGRAFCGRMVRVGEVFASAVVLSA